MRHCTERIEAVPVIIDVVGKFFLYFGLPCTLHELIEDASYYLNENKAKLYEVSSSSGIDTDENEGKVATSEGTNSLKQIIPQLSFKYGYISK